MIKSITVENHLGKQLTLELTRPEKSGLIVTSVEGLGPAKSSINITDISTGDGGVFNSSRLDKRNIVIDLAFLQTGNETIEDIRQKTYLYFPVKKKVRLTIVTDNRTLETEGYVESNEPNIFSASEGCQISVICPDPLFYSPENSTTSFSGVKSAFGFPFSNESLTEPLLEMGELQNQTEQVIVYDGNAEIGMTIHIHSLGMARNITVINVLTGEKMIINTDKMAQIIDDNAISYPYYGIESGGEVNIGDYYPIYLKDDGNGTLSMYGNSGKYTYAGKTVYITHPLSGVSASELSDMCELAYGKYIFTGCPDGGGTDTCYFQIRISDKDFNVKETVYRDTGSGVVFDVDEEDGAYVEIALIFAGSQTINTNWIFEPKIIHYESNRLVAGDSIIITTMRGEKGITLLRDGVSANILNCLEKGSAWFTLVTGDNMLSYNAEEGAANLQFYIDNKIAYDGV